MIIFSVIISSIIFGYIINFIVYKKKQNHFKGYIMTIITTMKFKNINKLLLKVFIFIPFMLLIYFIITYLHINLTKLLSILSEIDTI